MYCQIEASLKSGLDESSSKTQSCFFNVVGRIEKDNLRPKSIEIERQFGCLCGGGMIGIKMQAAKNFI